MVDAKIAVDDIRKALSATITELETEQQQLHDAQRRGRMAQEIGDQETAGVAEKYIQRHTERVDFLTRKRLVQEEELQLAENELAEMKEHYRLARQGVMPPSPTEPPRRETTLAEDLSPNAALLDQQARKAAVEAQLAALKRKLGKDGT